MSWSSTSLTMVTLGTMTFGDLWKEGNTPQKQARKTGSPFKEWQLSTSFAGKICIEGRIVACTSYASTVQRQER
ncbi:hypothetical protein RHMOL_Rhmol06G0138000 [Rhododendron molle]|uniref:Uncharacterized protein n=1 Tax=Rhododendron molle TaxID=49168 RepID=A0ACC0NCM1_RHOML|nr:hypothetical protein RHMOL_Rhmol06G0138000 [Rhododendron molle]